MFINHSEDTWRGIKKRKQHQLHLNDETKTVGIQLVLRLRKVGYFLNLYLEFRFSVSARVLKNSPSLIVIDYHWLILMISWCRCLWPVSQPFIFFSSILHDIIVPEWQIAAAEKQWWHFMTFMKDSSVSQIWQIGGSRFGNFLCKSHREISRVCYCIISWDPLAFGGGKYITRPVFN